MSDTGWEGSMIETVKQIKIRYEVRNSAHGWDCHDRITIELLVLSL